MSAQGTGKIGGWKVLGIWVTLAFLVLIGAWVTLIRVASDNAPEPVPLESKGG